MFDYSNIVVKSHKGIGCVTYNEYTQEEIEIIEKNISVLSKDGVKKYLDRLLNDYGTKLKNLIYKINSEKSDTLSDSIEARKLYLKTIIEYLKRRMEPFIDVANIQNSELTGINHIMTLEHDRYKINNNVKLIDFIRLLYCLNLEYKFSRVLLTKEIIEIISGKFSWREGIKSKTLKTYINQMDSIVKRERSKLSKDLTVIDESAIIKLVNELIS